MKKTFLASCLLVLGASAMAQTLADDSAAAIWRVTSRLGYGPTPALVQAASSAGARAWSLAQLDAAREASLRPARLPTALQALSADQRQVSAGFHREREADRIAREMRASAMSPSMAAPAADASGNNPREYSRDMAQASAAWRLAACSNPDLENPLLARMTEFWFNHFNVFIDKGPVRPYVGNYLLTAIRPHALGKFEDLVLATAQHPAMLNYLDQAQSNARGLNENYARELMELHTLGVQGGYTQADVRELARILTGWSVDIAGGEGFVFRPRAHEAGTKTLMGKEFAQAGQQQGIEAIRFLARNPATARRVSARIATFFVADKPSPGLVDLMAATFIQTGGDIYRVMQTLIASPEFWSENNTLFKTPLDTACSALAAVGSISDEAQRLQILRQSLGFLSQTGQRMHGWQTPDGYKTDAATWLAPESLTRRADYAFGLAGRVEEPKHLMQFYSKATVERISRETSAYIRNGLMLSAPEFMSK